MQKPADSSPGEFLEKLSALIPQPKSHLVTWMGVFAPNSRLRKEIVLNPGVKKGFDFFQEEEKLVKNSSWAKMLAQVFGLDLLTCERCGGKMRAVAAVKDRASIVRYLKHVGLPPEAPARGPPRLRGLAFDKQAGGLTYEPLH